MLLFFFLGLVVPFSPAKIFDVVSPTMTRERREREREAGTGKEARICRSINLIYDGGGKKGAVFLIIPRGRRDSEVERTESSVVPRVKDTNLNVYSIASV